jgi:hypothetical protein
MLGSRGKKGVTIALPQLSWCICRMEALAKYDRSRYFYQAIAV